MGSRWLKIANWSSVGRVSRGEGEGEGESARHVGIDATTERDLGWMSR